MADIPVIGTMLHRVSESPTLGPEWPGEAGDDTPELVLVEGIEAKRCTCLGRVGVEGRDA